MDNEFKLISNFHEALEIEFYEILHALGKIGCTYLSYAIEYPGQERINFFSNQLWKSVYIQENFVSTCQLAQLCRIKGNLFIPWEAINPINKQTKLVWDARSDHNIANGCTIANKYGDAYEMIAIASNNKNKRLLQSCYDDIEYLNNNLQRLRKIGSVPSKENALK